MSGKRKESPIDLDQIVEQRYQAGPPRPARERVKPWERPVSESQETGRFAEDSEAPPKCKCKTGCKGRCTCTKAGFGCGKSCKCQSCGRSDDNTQCGNRLTAIARLLRKEGAAVTPCFAEYTSKAKNKIDLQTLGEKLDYCGFTDAFELDCFLTD